MFSFLLPNKTKRVRELAELYKSFKNSNLSEEQKMITVAGEGYGYGGSKKLKEEQGYSIEYLLHVKEIIKMKLGIDDISKININDLIKVIVSIEYPNEKLTIEAIRDKNSKYNRIENELRENIEFYLK